MSNGDTLQAGNEMTAPKGGNRKERSEIIGSSIAAPNAIDRRKEEIAPRPQSPVGCAIRSV